MEEVVGMQGLLWMRRQGRRRGWMVGFGALSLWALLAAGEVWGQNATSTTVTCLPDPVVVGQMTTCTVTVTDTAQTPSTPTGDVTFTSSGTGSFTPSNTCTLSGTGASASCSVDYTPTARDTGTHTITASYPGDANHFGSSGSFNLTVNPRQTQTTVSCTFDFSPNFVNGGSTVTCTATVTDIDPNGTKSAPLGTVSFTTTGAGTFSNPGSSCTLTATGPDTSQCSVDYTPAAGSDGTHTLTGAYSGSTVHGTSSGTTDLAVDDTAPTITSTIPGSPKHPAGCNPPSTCFVTSATDININVADPTVNGVSSGLASCTIDITGPASASPACAAGDNTFRLDATLFGSPPPDGTYTLSISATDNVGNSSNDSFQVTLDNTPPTISDPVHTNSTCYPSANCDAPPETVQAGTFVKALDQPSPLVPASTFEYPSVDDGTGSGVQSCTLSGTQSDGNYPGETVEGVDFRIASGDGAKTFSLTCTDNLGNSYTNTSPQLIVDDTPPQISKDIPGAPTHLGGSPAGTECEGDPGTNCYVSSITLLRVTILEPPAGTEPGSGFDHCTIQATGQHYGNVYTPGCQEGDNDFTLPASLADDRYLVAVPIVRDNLGNTNSQDPLLDVILDNTAPTITTPLHTNPTCWPLDRCDAPPEAVFDGTWVKARDKLPFTPTNPHLPPYPQFIPRSTFRYPEAGSAVDPTPIEDPAIAPGLPGSGLLDCTLSGGTTADGVYTPGFGAIDFSFLPGDGARTFRLDCRDNLSYGLPVNTSFDQRTLHVDDTPPEATFVTSGPRYDDPTDGTIFVKTTTEILPVLTDAGVGVDLYGDTGHPFDGPPGNPPCRQNLDQDGTLTMACQTPFTFPPPDRDHHLWIVRPDKLGNVAESHFVFLVDDTPPAVRLLTPQDHAQYLLRERVLAEWEVTDDVSFFGPQEAPLLPPGVEPRGSGIAQVLATTPNGHPLDTTSVGAKIFTITVLDNLGHSTTVTVTYRVVYDFFLDPVLRERLASGSLRAGEEVSLAFRLLDAQGTILSDADPVISLVDPETGEVVRDFLPHNRARFDEETGFYTFVFSTEGLGPGEYEIWVQPGDTTTRRIRLGLR